MTTLTISDQLELTIDAEVLKRAGFQPGDSVRVNESAGGIVILRSGNSRQHTDLEAVDGMGTGARIEEIVNYVRELRGHDEFD